MAGASGKHSGPDGGLEVRSDSVRRWNWTPSGELVSNPVRCKREQWYLVRGFASNGDVGAGADLNLRFIRDDEIIEERCVALSSPASAEAGEALLGWVESPDDATHLQVRLPITSPARRLEKLTLHPVADRDPKCHPLANAPRWSVCEPRFPIDRVVLPASLESLSAHLGGLQIDVIRAPRSLRKLAAAAIGAACIVDPAWISDLGFSLRDLERVAAGSWMIIDLESLATLARASGAADTKITSYESEHEIMSARVDYADVHTRGFAMLDVLPYSTFVGRSSFGTRVLRANRSWKRYAAEAGFATLLASETPWEEKCDDVLSAARPVEQGELIATDLPWLVAGVHGRLLAPRLAEHLLRTHLAQPVGDQVQYWNSWDLSGVLLRDIGETPRRYPPLRAVRWKSGERGIASLGIVLPPIEESARTRNLMIRTGRIDRRGGHDGVPPEPMAIFIKWLTREWRERTRWAVRYLKNTSVTWQFDAGDGLKYALLYDSAAGIALASADATLLVRSGDLRTFETPTRERAADPWRMMVPSDAGVYGDRSFEYQTELTTRTRRWIEQQASS